MFSNWPCSVEKEGRKREGGGAEREGYRHRGDEEGKRYEWIPVCSAARARVYPKIEI